MGAAYKTWPMQLFAKRFWGFDPQIWPIIAFGREGSRDALIRASKPGDRITFIGTQGPETDEPDQGRLLGVAEIGHRVLLSQSILSPEVYEASAHASGGSFKWPYALPIVRAWRFLDKPVLIAVLGRQLPRSAATNAILLPEAEQQLIEALAVEVVSLADNTALRREQGISASLATSGPTTGPRPSSWTGTTERDASAPAKTYAFRFGLSNIWKVGHAQDTGSRLKDVNLHVPSETIGQEWQMAHEQPWSNQGQAYEMEQRLLTILSAQRTVGERVCCTEGEMASAWIRAFLG